MSTSTQIQERSVSSAVKRGAIAGLGGGLAFGLMMAMMGMLPMVGMLVGVENAIVGFVVHLIISAIIGAIFGIIAIRLSPSWGPMLVAGAVYGVIWWVLGALILMPLMLGMTQMILAIGGPQWMSLLGHILYGVVTGLLFVLLRGRV